MPSSTKYHCKSMDKYISISDGFEKCIKDHECFSDDPCPFQDQLDSLLSQEKKMQRSTDVALKFQVKD